MQPDGHCMYRAVQDQLSLRSDNDHQQTHDVMKLRKKTADYIRQHRSDFLPFLIQVCCIPPVTSCKLLAVGHPATMSPCKNELTESRASFTICHDRLDKLKPAS